MLYEEKGGKQMEKILCLHLDDHINVNGYCISHPEPLNMFIILILSVFSSVSLQSFLRFIARIKGVASDRDFSIFL